jgi:serine protease Do
MSSTQKTNQHQENAETIHPRLRELNDAMAHIITTVHQALVQIHNGERGIGAGTIWHSQGLILTNAHVVEGYGRRDHLTLSLPDGRELPARIIETNRQYDLAALYVEADDLPTITLGDSHQLRVGDVVFAIGHPWGVKNAVTTGIVIGLSAPPEVQMPQEEWIAVDAHMRPGHSGGPLVNDRGQLIGINTMITGPAVGYAIPIHVVKRFLKESIGEAATA